MKRTGLKSPVFFFDHFPIFRLQKRGVTLACGLLHWLASAIVSSRRKGLPQFLKMESFHFRASKKRAAAVGQARNSKGR